MTRVLVVDDDPQFRRVVRIALAASGYEVSEAADGLQALDEMGAKPINVVLLDWEMPRMAGAAACKAIRARSEVPIIVVTASDSVRDASAIGVDAILRKPVNIEALRGRIETALEVRGIH